MAPMDVGRPRVGGNPHPLVADVHAAGADRPALARRLAVEAEEADSTDGHTGASRRRRRDSPPARSPVPVGRASRRRRPRTRRPAPQKSSRTARSNWRSLADSRKSISRRACSDNTSPASRARRSRTDSRPEISGSCPRPADRLSTRPVESSPPLLEGPQGVGCGSFNAFQRQDELIRWVFAREARKPSYRSVHTVEQGGVAGRRVLRNGRLGEQVAPTGRA